MMITATRTSRTNRDAIHTEQGQPVSCRRKWYSLYGHIGRDQEYQHDAGDSHNLIAPVATITIALQYATELLIEHMVLV